ncbi:hypothetical protein SAMN04489713_11056 [Actinomadura madurae]|uniref:Nitroreductase family protein n=1 Tax=Actinomadura madurae TaxID=1993 RepID=A0A1I5KMA9_9ACTN|nr:hypothetical protein [Actinomadura madurae]SFO86047.1 hypothetical protein SAMN04489713_11056 [Actinomadura madurae]
MSILRDQLSIPDGQTIVGGVALGYADPDHVLSTQRTTREPVEAIVDDEAPGRTRSKTRHVTKGNQVAEL